MSERCEAVVYRPRFIPGDGVEYGGTCRRFRGRCRKRAVYFDLCKQHYRMDCTHRVERVSDPMRSIDTRVKTVEGIGDD